MFTLTQNLNQISAGAYSEACYNAYENMLKDSFSNVMLLLIFFPLGMASMYGDMKEVKGICGSWAAYDEASAAYCLKNPKICEKG